MTTLSERVAGERRRLRQVREALTAATGEGSGGNPDWVPFYIAIADYFETTMERLHAQDVRMGDMLREKADMENEANQVAMAELEERLTGNQRHLEEMLDARGALQKSGAESLDRFEAAGGAYAGYIVANMGHHAGTADLARDVFSSEDWEHMAAITDEAQEREAALYDEVFRNVPDDLELPERD